MLSFRKFFISTHTTGGVIVGASFFGPSSSQKEQSQLVKISDLPVYEEQPPASKQAYHVEHVPAPALEQKVSEVRRRMNFHWPEGSQKTRERISDVYQTGKAHTLSSLDMLRDDSQVLPRAVVITAGGLLGLLASYRRGFFRKLIYTSLGIGGAAAVCYPKAAKDVVNAAYSQATTLVKGFEKKTTTPNAHIQLSTKEDSHVKQDVSKTAVAIAGQPSHQEHAAGQDIKMERK